MKFLSVFRPAVLSAVIVLLSAASCSDRSGQVSSALAATDSLMMTQPQAALDTLNGIDAANSLGGTSSRTENAGLEGMNILNYLRFVKRLDRTGFGLEIFTQYSERKTWK